MPISTLSALAGAGLTAVLAVGVPATASADTGSAGASSADAGRPAAACAWPDDRRAAIDLLIDHPEVAAVLQELRRLPADERTAEWAGYLEEHPDVADAVGELREEVRWDVLRWDGARSGVVRSVVDALAGHPELAALLAELRDTPVGERGELVRDHAADHPEVRAELRDLARTAQLHRQACRADG